MDKKDSFKLFAKTHPELISSVKSGEASWQKLYEIILLLVEFRI